MGAMAVPEHRRRGPRRESVLDQRGPTALQPAPAHGPGPRVDGEQQIRPLIAELEALDDLDAAAAQHAAHLAAQTQPQLVGEHAPGVPRHAGLDECGRHPPARQASRAAGSAFSATGRGTLGRTPSRCKLM